MKVVLEIPACFWPC